MYDKWLFHKKMFRDRRELKAVEGRMKHTDLERPFKDRIEDNSTLCTDSHKNYIKFGSVTYISF